MGRDQHTSHEIAELQLHGKKHNFHIVPNNFPIPEEGLVGRSVLQPLNYNMNNQHLTLNGIKHTLHDEGYFIPGRTMRILDIDTQQRCKHVMISHPYGIDAVYTVRQGKIRLPIYNHQDEQLNFTHEDITITPIKIQYDRTTSINSQEISQRIKLLLENTRLNHCEKTDRNTLWKIISAYNDVFALPGDPLPCSSMAEHTITLKDTKPINNTSYKPPEAHRHEISRQINEMLNKRIITHSKSPYNSPIWVVPKKADASGKKKWRIVIDFRKLNEKTDQDAYPLPVIEDILDHLGKSKYFSCFDLSSGFHQIPMEENSKKYTAFSTPEGHFEYERMPFGLKNAPATFQRMMDTALRGLIGKTCFVYLDDIVVFGTTLQEHHENLIILLNRLRSTGLKLQPDKCEYLRPELEYLGHLITKDGVKPNPEKLKAIRDFK